MTFAIGDKVKIKAAGHFDLNEHWLGRMGVVVKNPHRPPRVLISVDILDVDVHEKVEAYQLAFYEDELELVE
jgi:hypothetical protein